jgi:hypothetical protein
MIREFFLYLSLSYLFYRTYSFSSYEKNENVQQIDYKPICYPFSK